MKKFKNFFIEKITEEKENYLKIKYNLSDSETKNIINEVSKRDLQFKDDVIETIMRLINLRNEKKGEKTLKLEKKKEMFDFLMKKIDEEKTRKNKVEENFKNIFSSFGENHVKI